EGVYRPEHSAARRGATAGSAARRRAESDGRQRHRSARQRTGGRREPRRDAAGGSEVDSARSPRGPLGREAGPFVRGERRARDADLRDRRHAFDGTETTESRPRGEGGPDVPPGAAEDRRGQRGEGGG